MEELALGRGHESLQAHAGVLVAKPPERKDDDDASRKSSRSNKSQADPEMGGSNVYSVGECVLLKWFSYHSGNGTGAPAGLGKRYNTFGKAFGDGAAVCGCVASNAAHLVESGGALARRSVRSGHASVRPTGRRGRRPQWAHQCDPVPSVAHGCASPVVMPTTLAMSVAVAK